LRRRAAGPKYLAYHDVTPEGVWSHTADGGRSANRRHEPQMFNSFLDGTKSAIEMAAIANATGLDVPPTACCSRPAASTTCRM